MKNSLNVAYACAKKMAFSKLLRQTPLAKLSLTAALLIPTFNAYADVTLVEESLVTDNGLYFWYQNGSKAFHYNPNISPRGDCVTIANGYIYFGWYKGGMTNRQLMLSRKKIGSGDWVSVEFPYQNTLIGAQKRWGDSHNTISVGVSEKDGTIHIFYDHHNDPLKYVISKKNAAFVDDSAFTSDIFNPTRGYLAPGQNVTITYPTLTENDSGDLVLNYRKGSAIGGNEIVHYYNGEQWSRSKQVSRGAGRDFVAVRDRNYAYGRPVFANGNVYYAFSVRWARKKPDGILNEGVYLAKTGPTMTGRWEDLNGVKHALPVQDFSPFLIDLPDSNLGKGSSGGPGIAVTEAGDVHISYDGRGSGSTYEYTYTRKAGESRFTKHQGVKAAGIAWGDKIYQAKASRNGTIRINSVNVGSTDFTTELTLETPYKFGNAVSRIVDGQLVMVVEDRSVETDAQNIFSYVFDLGDATTDTHTQVLTDDFNFAANEGDNVVVSGMVDIAFGANGQYRFLYDQTRDTACNVQSFGDPAPGVSKQCFIKVTTPGPEIAFVDAPSTLEPDYQTLSLVVDATATTQNTDIDLVSLYVNDRLIREEHVAPYEWGHNGRDELLGLPEGEHTITAVAVDENGLKSQSRFVVSVESLRPSVYSASGYQAPNNPENLLDGDKTDDSRWTVNGYNNSVIWDLGAVRQINSVALWAYQNRAYQFKIEASESASSGFQVIYNAQDNSMPLSPLSAATDAIGRYVKITVTGAAGYNRNWVSINEIEIDSKPLSP